MTERGDTVWLVTGDSESGDRYSWTFDHEPSREELLGLVIESGDVGVADRVTLDDLDEDGYLLDEERWEDSEAGVWPGAGYGGSFIDLNVKEQVLR